VNAWNSYTEVRIRTASAARGITEPAAAAHAAVNALSIYPNPFHEANSIRFTLARAGHAHLALYDANGRQVALLVSESLPAGDHQASLGAARLPAGVYILELRHNGAILTRRLIKQ